MNQNSRLTEQGEPGKGRKRSRKAASADTADAAPRDMVPVARVEKAAEEATKKPGKTAVAHPATDGAPVGGVDIEQFSHNLARLVEESGRALAAYLKPRQDGLGNREMAEEVNEVAKTLAQVAQYWLGDPQRALELQARLDEENNIDKARMLQKAGVHVVYGIVGLKTHCKATLVVRRDHDGIRRYVHLGTGNTTRPPLGRTPT